MRAWDTNQRRYTVDIKRMLQDAINIADGKKTVDGEREQAIGARFAAAEILVELRRVELEEKKARVK